MLGRPSEVGENLRTSCAALAREIPWARFLLLVLPFHFAFLQTGAIDTDTGCSGRFWRDAGSLQTMWLLTVSPTSVCFIIHYVQISFFSLLLPTPVQKILHINSLYIKYVIKLAQEA